MTAHPEQKDGGHTTIVGLGEVLWDVYPDGDRFGGAPANFACAAAELSNGQADVLIVSGVGRDELGRRAIESLGEHRVDTSYVATTDQPTGRVNVRLDTDASATYEFAADAAWDNILWSEALEQLAAQTDVVCFGTLGQRSDVSRRTVQRFVAAVPSSALRVFDVNLRPPFISEDVILQSLKHANVLKLNDKELPAVARLCGGSGSIVDRLRQLARKFDLTAIALTRGPDGAILVRGDDVIECPGVETAVVDTVGAGDAFTAEFVLGLLRDDPLKEIGRNACNVAAYVCTQRGATPRLPRSIVA